jgi:hypothetical protein
VVEADSYVVGTSGVYDEVGVPSAVVVGTSGVVVGTS